VTRSDRIIRVWVYADIGGSGGYVRYCRGLFGTGRIPPDIKVVFVCSNALKDQVLPLDPSVRVLAHDWPAHRLVVLRYLWHLVLYPAKRAHFRPDVEFYPSGMIRPYPCSGLGVGTCHNQLLFDDAEFARLRASPGYAYFAAYRARQLSSIRRAAGVIALSETMKTSILHAVPAVPDIVVIPNGLDDAYRCTEPRAYTLGKTVRFLYVSPLFPYKHHAEVIRALASFRRESECNAELRLVGGGSADDQAAIDRVIAQERAHAWVQCVGPVFGAALLAEYRSADIFVFASSSEGFSITLLEAMGMRLPIVCSSRSGMPAVLRDAALYFDPENVEEIKSAVTALVGSEALRTELGERAFFYSADYSWSRCADETFDYIRQVVERGRRT
jgi:glycosyltransferase involved in cell wall biosynthesis